MKLWQWIKNNKQDIFVIALMSFIITVILSSFTFNTIAPQEGWYSIYARNILQDGLVPYRDFFLVVPPVFLYIWTVWQAIFGDNFIVFHYLGFLCQILCAVSFYFLFKQIFNKKTAFITALMFIIIQIFMKWDNGVASYNTLAMAFMALMALFTVKQVNFINTYKKISIKWLWLIGFMFATSFLNKQTSGAFSIMAASIILLAITYRNLGVKQTIRHFIYLLLISLAFLFIFLLPLLITGALPAMVNDIFMSTSKGSVSMLFVKLIFLPFPIDDWPYFILVIIFFFLLLPKLRRCDREGLEDVHLNKFLVVSLLISMALCFIVKSIPIANYQIFDKLQVSCFGSVYFLYHISFLITCLLLVYLSFLWIKEKMSARKLNLLIIVCFITFITFADILSNGYHYSLAISLCLGLLLSWKCNKLNMSKNILVFCFLGIFFVISFAYKLQEPMTFWGWQSGSIFNRLESSSVPRLKGMKIPAEEKQMYEEIYNIVHKYTNKDDTILAFNNNQIFYDLTERNPYTKYISLYQDVAPDNQPLEVLENMKRDLPKIIIFLRFPDEMENHHNRLFREDVSGQTILRDYIDTLIYNKTYIPAGIYQQSLSVDVSTMPKELLDRYNNINNLPVQEQKEIMDRIVALATVKNKFLQSGCSLLVLVRSDIIKQEVK